MDLFLDDVRRRRLRQIVDAGLGTFLCAGAAAGVSVISQGRSWEAWAPLLFVTVLLLVAAVFGALAGILSTVLSAIIFAAFLFQPLGDLRVSNEASRANLAWMLLMGIAYAFLFAPPQSTFRRR